MSRPSFFKDKKPEVLLYIKGLSNEYHERNDFLSLNNIAKKLRLKFKALPPPPKTYTAEQVAKAAKAGTALKPYELKDVLRAAKAGLGLSKADPLKLVVYRLCNSNGIWFGNPDGTPSRMKAAPAPEPKAKKTKKA